MCQSVQVLFVAVLINPGLFVQTSEHSVETEWVSIAITSIIAKCTECMPGGICFGDGQNMKHDKQLSNNQTIKVLVCSTTVLMSLTYEVSEASGDKYNDYKLLTC